jgi:hypothetical protein
VIKRCPVAPAQSSPNRSVGGGGGAGFATTVLPARSAEIPPAGVVNIIADQNYLGAALTSHYSYWDYQSGRWHKDEGLRIDHLLLSPPGRRPACRRRHRQGPARTGQALRPHARVVRSGDLTRL